MSSKTTLAYVVGIALGDGNLSNPNGRAVRLRITCDSRYEEITSEMISAIQKLLPHNKVSLIYKSKNCIDISCYSNQWPALLGWHANLGSKLKQKVRVPDWIKQDNAYIKKCLRGLFQTDGSVYKDRGYIMANFVNMNPGLIHDVTQMISCLGFQPNVQRWELQNERVKYTVRVSKNSSSFIRTINLRKDRSK